MCTGSWWRDAGRDKFIIKGKRGEAFPFFRMSALVSCPPARPKGFAIVPRPQSARASSLVSVDAFADAICATGAYRLTYLWKPSLPHTICFRCLFTLKRSDPRVAAHPSCAVTPSRRPHMPLPHKGWMGRSPSRGSRGEEPLAGCRGSAPTGIPKGGALRPSLPSA